MGSGNGQSVHRGGAGEPLVLIHGFSGTRLIWEPVLEALERSHDVLAVNLAGHVGGPELADTPVSVNALVDAVERELDASGFDTAHMVGNSLGGWIALELAARGRARSVVALSRWRLGAGIAGRAAPADAVYPQPQALNGAVAADRLPDATSSATPRAAVAGRRPWRADPPGCGSPGGPRLGRVSRVLRPDRRDSSRRAGARL